MVANDVRTKLPVGTKHVAVLAYALGEIEDDGLCKEMELLRQRDQRLSCLRLHIGGVDYRQTTTSEPLAHDLMQKIEGISGRRLVVLVIGD